MNEDLFVVSIQPVSLSVIDWNIITDSKKNPKKSNSDTISEVEDSQPSFQAYIALENDGDEVVVSVSQDDKSIRKNLKKIPSRTLTNGRRNQVALWGLPSNSGIKTQNPLTTDTVNKSKIQSDDTTSPSSVQFSISLKEDTNFLPPLSTRNNCPDISFCSKVLKVNVGVMSDSQDLIIGTTEMVITSEYCRGKVVDLPIRRLSRASENHEKSLSKGKSSLLKRMIGNKYKNYNKCEIPAFSLASNAVLRVRLDTVRRNEDSLSSSSRSLPQIECNETLSQESKTRGVLKDIEILDSSCNGDVEIIQTSSSNTAFVTPVKRNNTVSTVDQSPVSENENSVRSKGELNSINSTQNENSYMTKATFGLCGYESADLSPTDTHRSSNEFSSKNVLDETSIYQQDRNKLGNNRSSNQCSLLSVHSSESLSADDTNSSRDSESENFFYPKQISLNSRICTMTSSNLSVSTKQTESTVNYIESSSGSCVFSEFSSSAESSLSIDSLDRAKETLRRHADRVGMDVRDLVL